MPSRNLETMIDIAYGFEADRFFRIKVEDGETLLEGADGRDYPFLRWRGDLKLPLAKSIGIEFDGIWEYDEPYGRYNFMGAKKPYIYWVEMDGSLYTRLWDEEDTQFLIAEDVVRFSVVRGWKNVNYWEQDHGIVVAYIKTNGKAYYRNFAQQPLNRPTAWEEERLIESSGRVQGINAFRTNDYRTGILLESDGKIHWTITERNWAGMGVPSHSVSVAPVEVTADLIDIEYPVVYAPDEFISVAPVQISPDLRYAKTDNKFITIHNEMVIAKDENNEDVEDWGKRLIVRTQHELYQVFTGDFEILDEFNTPYYPDVVTEIEDSVYQLDFLEFNNFNNVDKKGTLRFRGTATKNGVGDLYEPFEMRFYPINLVPTIIPLPEVKDIWNE